MGGCTATVGCSVTDVAVAGAAPSLALVGGAEATVELGVCAGEGSGGNVGEGACAGAGEVCTPASSVA